MNCEICINCKVSFHLMLLVSRNVVHKATVQMLLYGELKCKLGGHFDVLLSSRSFLKL